ncbi:Fusaric acid resistance protein [Bordetella tumulicola]
MICIGSTLKRGVGFSAVLAWVGGSLVAELVFSLRCLPSVMIRFSKWGAPTVRFVADFFLRFRTLLGELTHDFLRPSRSLPRFLDEIEMLASVCLAIAFAHLLGAHNAGWAAFSGYLVMRSQLRATLTRGALRVLGTLVGAGAACLLAGVVENSDLWVSLSIALVGTATLYCAMTRVYSYAWLLASLTFAMVALDALQHPAVDVFVFATTRILEVTAGTCASVIVSMLSTLTVRSRLAAAAATPSAVPASRVSSEPPKVDPTLQPLPSQNAISHAAQAGLALALTPFLGRWMDVQSFSQAAITIIVVMMVPLSSPMPLGKTVRTKNIHRFLGCLAGAMVAGIMVLVFGPSWITFTLGMSLGVLFGRHIENSGRSFAYVGTQFSLVYLVLMVPDSYAHINVERGIDRLDGIVVGMLLVELARLLSFPWLRKSARS